MMWRHGTTCLRIGDNADGREWRLHWLRGNSHGCSAVKAVIDGSGNGVEIVLQDDARELERLTILEFEQWVRGLTDLAREARAETTRRARLSQLPMKR